ncbi:MAG TPA: peptidoglycan DD-metalloendopeptidase family protein [Candidatus Cloacimonadota bacterium]|nr:peptidoglycan DD-metalloendopeptidase family protein [Candidatus Cloacimonadota bacterium]
MVPEPPATDPWITGTIPDGGSFYSVLEGHGLPALHVAIVSYRMGEYIDVTTVQPGDTLKIKLNKDRQTIDKMQFVQEPTVRHNFTVTPDSLIYTVDTLPVLEQYRLITGELQGTLDASLLAAGLQPNAKQSVNNGLESEVNFSRDARNGDRFTVLIKERIFENKALPGTQVYYVKYEGERVSAKELWRYTDSSDPKSVLNGLYNKDGKSNNTSGVGYPLGSIHVVSRFGYRADPFTGRSKMHQGVDYRARMGTPVYAIANGVVTEARYHGGWGNNVQIKHSSGVESQYAHLSSMSVRAGQRVVRGQVIGRVGSTGRSTGAHLHFGLISGGKFINPNQLKMAGAETLSEEQKRQFAQQKQNIMLKVTELSRAVVRA